MSAHAWAEGEQELRDHSPGHKAPSPRRRLPLERNGLTRRFTLGGCELHISVGEFEDGSPGEIFLHAAKRGSTVNGLLDAWAIMVSVALQSGVPLEAIVAKFLHMRFDPQGHTGDFEIPTAASPLDLVAQWLRLRYLTPTPSAVVRWPK